MTTQRLTHRVCKKCGVSQPLDAAHFKPHLGNSPKRRLIPVCRECERRAAREKYQANRRLARKLEVIRQHEADEAPSDQPICRTPTDRGTVIVSFKTGWRPTPNRQPMPGFSGGSTLNRIDL
jgi:hypothetical protein